MTGTTNVNTWLSSLVSPVGFTAQLQGAELGGLKVDQEGEKLKKTLFIVAAIVILGATFLLIYLFK